MKLNEMLEEAINPYSKASAEMRQIAVLVFIAKQLERIADGIGAPRAK